MSEQLVLERALVVGVDPHRECLDVIGICFPEEGMLDEAFANTRAGHEARWSKVKGLAAGHDLSLVFGLEDGSNYGYALARYLLRQGCQVKEVNPRMTNRQRNFYGQDKTNRLDALATAAIVMRAHQQLPDLAAVEEATEATLEFSRYREQLVRNQTAAVNRLHGYRLTSIRATRASSTMCMGSLPSISGQPTPRPPILRGSSLSNWLASCMTRAITASAALPVYKRPPTSFSPWTTRPSASQTC